jgi:hypothetical protein
LTYAMFNPHQKLAAGNWYWQIKSGTGNWSKAAVLGSTKLLEQIKCKSVLQEAVDELPESIANVLAMENE